MIINNPNDRIHPFLLIGFPKVLRSDNGPAFIAKSAAEHLKSMGIDHQLSAPYNHTSNAFAERFNNTLRAAIRVYKNKNNLSVIVAHFVYTYNRTKNLKTGLTPAQILLNSSDNGLHELIKDTKERFDNDIQRHGRKLNPGDLVLRKVMIRKDSETSQKNQLTWEVPFKIIKHLYGDTYEIERVGKRTRSAIEKVHVDRLKLYVE
uniref:Integrase catalytic domain-containing protein n=1 Tax=Strongyloides papillosus TaxID=174720 RepID=A0A0N5BQV6_STREA